ncbi:protein NSP-INTERACTING KINASE 3-like [Populus alba x Populus x berolinensis]|nr:protein NSP-INTERACTING KINASE 3-like [Populus alba x Populus x berolinensis]
MESRRSFGFCTVVFLVLALMEISSATLSPTGINFEVVALMAIKTALLDPYNVLENWDINSVDPCSWRMVTCSLDGYVSALGLPSQSLSGTLSPSIGNLTNLQSVLLQNNAISGPIPTAIGKLEKLQTLDLSNNTFSGDMPTSLGDLKNLNYLRLNNNSLTGPCPESLSYLKGLTLVDLSFNNLSGSLPKISARTFKVTGNPLICGPKASNSCSAVFPEPLSVPPDGLNGVYHMFNFFFLFVCFYLHKDRSYMFFASLWIHRSIQLWNKWSPCGYCFWCKLWCCLFHHNSYWVTCLVAI